MDKEIIPERCIFTVSFHMFWCVLIATSSVSVFTGLCLHMGSVITVPVATRSGICFQDCEVILADIVQQTCYMSVLLSHVVYICCQKRSVSESIV